MTDIFLSYTERDRDKARRVAAVLGAAGWSVWWDRRIPAGDTWRSVLERALEDMRCMVVLWSTRSIESEWVYEEASEGRRQGKLVPVMIENVRPPAGFREIQAADLTDWDGSPDFDGLKMLLTDLENMLGKPVSAAPERQAKAIETEPGESPPAYDPTDLAATKTRQAWWRQSSLAGLAAAGALSLAAGAGYVAWSNRQPVTVEPEVHLPEQPKTTLSPLTPAATAPAPNRPAESVVAAVPPLTVVKNKKPATPPVNEKVKTARSAGIESRCAELLTKVQLGESLSYEAQAVFQKECR